MNRNKYLELRVNARKWHHEEGGIIKAADGTNLYINTGRTVKKSQENKADYEQRVKNIMDLSNPEIRDIPTIVKEEVNTIVAAPEKTDWTSDYLITSTPTTTVVSTTPVKTGVRSDRNNNPLNIRFTNIAWQGKKTDGKTDNAFEEFETRDYGWRAAYKNLNKKISIDGLNSIRKLISSWAPANENNTEGYISYVSEKTGIDPDAVLSSNDERLAKIGAAMAAVESGRRNNIDWEDALKGFKFYLGQPA